MSMGKGRYVKTQQKMKGISQKLIKSTQQQIKRVR